MGWLDTLSDFLSDEQRRQVARKGVEQYVAPQQEPRYMSVIEEDTPTGIRPSQAYTDKLAMQRYEANKRMGNAMKAAPVALATDIPGAMAGLLSMPKQIGEYVSATSEVPKESSIPGKTVWGIADALDAIGQVGGEGWRQIGDLLNADREARADALYPIAKPFEKFMEFSEIARQATQPYLGKKGSSLVGAAIQASPLWATGYAGLTTPEELAYALSTTKRKVPPITTSPLFNVEWSPNASWLWRQFGGPLEGKFKEMGSQKVDIWQSYLNDLYKKVGKTIELATKDKNYPYEPVQITSLYEMNPNLNPFRVYFQHLRHNLKRTKTGDTLQKAIDILPSPLKNFVDKGTPMTWGEHLGSLKYNTETGNLATVNPVVRSQRPYDTLHEQTHAAMKSAEELPALEGLNFLGEYLIAELPDEVSTAMSKLKYPEHKWGGEMVARLSDFLQMDNPEMSRTLDSVSVNWLNTVGGDRLGDYALVYAKLLRDPTMTAADVLQDLGAVQLRSKKPTSIQTGFKEYIDDRRQRSQNIPYFTESDYGTPLTPNQLDLVYNPKAKQWSYGYEDPKAQQWKTTTSIDDAIQAALGSIDDIAAMTSKARKEIPVAPERPQEKPRPGTQPPGEQQAKKATMVKKEKRVKYKGGKPHAKK